VSDSSRAPREWRFYIADMIGFASSALSYTEGLSKVEFVADSRTYDATLRNLELIGEAARNIPEEVRLAPAAGFPKTVGKALTSRTENQPVFWEKSS
jgi:uncharacterized protein with HEPN domain